MAIYRLIKRDGSYDPEAIKVLADSYEAVLRSLHLVDRSDPLTEIIAHKIIAAHKNGSDNPKLIAKQVLEELQ